MNSEDKAVAAWQAGGDSMFEFMIEASYIVGKREDGATKSLGKRIKRSEDTVERYAKGGLLWHAMVTKYPADSELLRDALDWQYWLALAPLWSKNVVSLYGAKMWMDHAIDNKWEYEKFLSLIPKPKNVDSEWQKTARHAADLIDDLINSPAFDVNETKYKAGLKLLKMASVWLKGMTMSNVIELLISNKIADNGFRAAHIANGLRLAECKTDEEILARARLYRDWRTSQIFGRATQPCYEKAIAGEAVPAQTMFQNDVVNAD